MFRRKWAMTIGGALLCGACSPDPRPALVRFGNAGGSAQEGVFRLVWWPRSADGKFEASGISRMFTEHPAELLVVSGGADLPASFDGLPGGLQRAAHGENAAFFMATPLAFEGETTAPGSIHFALMLEAPLSAVCSDRTLDGPAELILGPTNSATEALAGFLSKDGGTLRVPSDWILDSAREIHTPAGTAYYSAWQR